MSALILALPIAAYLSLCALPRAAGSLYTIGVMFLLAQIAQWTGIAGQGAALLSLTQVAIVLAGLVQGLRLLALPAAAPRGRYIALVFGGALIGAAILRRTLGA